MLCNKKESRFLDGICSLFLRGLIYREDGIGAESAAAS
jgi:hypothetical protein